MKMSYSGNRFQSVANIFKTALCALFLLPAVALVFIMFWARRIWEDLEFEQILANIATPIPSFDILEFSPEFKYYILGAAITFILLLGMLNNRRLLIVATVFWALSVWQLRLIPYIYYQHTPTTLYENYYKAPQIDAIGFPGDKRNLILIYVESLEQNFSRSETYGKNLLPNLSQLAQENPSFDNYKKLYGTDYTIAALLAGHCGIPYRTSQLDTMSARNKYNNIVCLPDVLSANGYETWFAQSSPLDFARTDLFIQKHQYANIVSKETLEQAFPKDVLQNNQSAFNGLSDKLLLSYVDNLFAEGKIQQPFLFTIFTIDTHMPGTQKLEGCPNVFNDIRDNIICADKNIFAFVSALQKTPYWQNTSIAIVGDHPMPKEPQTLSKTTHRRGIYNVFLNLPQNLPYDSKKLYTAIDLAPTYLEILGGKLDNHAFGLGRSLFSGEPGLISIPEADLATAVKQKSELYDSFNKNNITMNYIPYKLGTALDKNGITAYAPFHEAILDHIYLDHLGLKLDTAPKRNLTLKLTFNAMLSFKPRLTVTLNGKIIKEAKLDKSFGAKTLSFTIPAKYLDSPELHFQFENNNYRSVMSQCIEILDFNLY